MNLLQTLKAKLLRALAKRMKAKFVYDAALYPPRTVEERHIPTAWGPARALFYWPDTSPGEPLPVYLNLHGGGFVAGVPEHDDSYCRRLAHNLGCLVVNLDYVLAPSIPFRRVYARASRCWSGWPGRARRWVSTHSASLSAGTALAAIWRPVWRIWREGTSDSESCTKSSTMRRWTSPRLLS